MADHLATALAPLFFVRLVPALLKIKGKEDKRKGGTDSASRRVDFGTYEDTIEQYVASACTTQAGLALFTNVIFLVILQSQHKLRQPVRSM